MSFWLQFKQSNCLPHNCGCEFISDAFIRQPINFWSSFVYIGLALFLYREIEHKSDELKLWTGVTILLGISSLLGHMSFTQLMMSMDFASIIMVISFFALVNLFTLLKQSFLRIIFILVAYFVFLVFCMYVMDKWTKVAICVAVFAFAVGDLVRDIGWKFLRARILHYALLILSLSFVLFLLDELKLVCEPHGPFQLHSFWHLGTALSIYLYGKWRFSAHQYLN